jgi:hypothetical protein
MSDPDPDEARYALHRLRDEIMTLCHMSKGSRTSTADTPQYIALCALLSAIIDLSGARQVDKNYAKSHLPPKEARTMAAVDAMLDECGIDIATIHASLVLFKETF